jgi:Acyl-CoA dehydrogenase, C-terminal domain
MPSRTPNAAAPSASAFSIIRCFEGSSKPVWNHFDLRSRSPGLIDEVWMERPPYAERYQLFRLAAHLAKYWTAEFAIDTAKWAMEVHGGLGVLAEYRVERWLREAMILAIWEGTSHRQILDGLEVIERRQAHKLLFERLAKIAPAKELQEMESEI